nr:uncharacterized protein LOC109732126 [Aegilops tauschii subsp. strangulata]
MFTFHQHSGKRKALDEGPWMFNNPLLVVEDFDPAKSTKDYKFMTVPIWVRVFDLPLGMMCREAGLAIGDIVGEALEVDAGSDGMAVGKFLRVKVRMDITKPIMRRFVLEKDGGKAQENDEITEREQERKEEEKWCRFEYEFLPDFCYTCGMLDHVDKECSYKLKKGESKQFGPWLKAFIPRSSSETSRGSWSDGRGKPEGRSSGGGKSRSWGHSGGRSGSDSDNWRKDKSVVGHQLTELENREAEVTSPMKKKGDPMQVEAPAKSGREIAKGTVALKHLTYESRGSVGEQKHQGESSVIEGVHRPKGCLLKFLRRGRGGRN